MNYKRLLTAALLAIPLTFMAGSAQAAAITGQANIAGNVSVTANSVLFSPTFTNATVGSTETGSFAGLTGGTIQSLTGGPVTGTVSIPDFIVFTTGVAAPIHFDLTYIAPGVGNLADCSSSMLGASCTPTGSPFTLIQLTSNTVVASLQLNGDGYIDPKSSGTSNTVGIFTTQVVSPGTIPEVLAQLQAAGGIQGQTYSASFMATPVSPVPEPTSMLLLGMGLVGAGLITRRRKSA